MFGSHPQDQLSALGDNARNNCNHCEFFGRARILVVGLVVLLVTNGCTSERRVPVFPVTGKVTFQGKPPVGAQVVLNRVGGSQDDVIPTATVQNDGSFTITSYEVGDGAPEGDYVATIQWYKITPELNGPGPNVIPKQYAAGSTSPVKVKVGNGPTQIPTITIN